MEQTVQIPEGYEYSHMAEPILSNGSGVLSVILKKKNIKNFDFYVDEYLRSDDCTTNDMICNWWDRDTLEVIGNNLKQNKLQFVPWEVKIGLFRFICKDRGVNYRTALNAVIANGAQFVDTRIEKIITSDFLKSIIV